MDRSEPTAHTVTAPGPVGAILALPGLAFVARLALASPFVVSGVTKLLHFPAAQAEVSGLGLEPAVAMAAALVATQLLGSALFLTRRLCWLGAGMLGVFTIIATAIAHPFWAIAGPDRAHQMAVAFEHAAIVGGLALAALHVHGVGPGRR